MNKYKLKVVWLCHFSNQTLQNKIKPWKPLDEYAPWIGNMLGIFELEENIELHVIVQHEYLAISKSIEHEGIFYHFIRKGIPIWGRHWPGFFRIDIWTNFAFWKWKVRSIVKRVNPDIIHLHGFENEFSGAILQFKKKYPIFITIQGYIGKATSSGIAIDFKKNQEAEIISSFTQYGVRTRTMEEDILHLNSKANTHWHQYPMGKIFPIDCKKEFDLVFFARITKDKGIEDLLYAVQLLKQTIPDISLCVIGGGNSQPFQNLCKSLDLIDNVRWAGFLSSQNDVHQLVAKAKLSILPTYHDMIPGTIVESLFLGIPVVAYDVGSIHELNEKNEVVSLVPKHDIKGLANEIKLLLMDEKLHQRRTALGYERVNEMFGQSSSMLREELIDIYKQVIARFKGHE